MISRGSAVFCVCRWDLLPADQTMHPEARAHRPGSLSLSPPPSSSISLSLSLSLVFLLKRRECSRVAAERIGGALCLSFLCSRGTVVSHEIPNVPSSSPHPRSVLPSLVSLARARADRNTHARAREAHTDLPFLAGLSRSRVFTFSTKSPWLCASLLRLPAK